MPVRVPAPGALVVVGMQNDLLHPDGFFGRRGLINVSAKQRQAVLDNVNALATAFRAAEWPVVQALWQLRPDHLNASYSHQWRRLGLRDAGALAGGSWGAALVDGLVVGADDFVLPLTSHSAFQFTPLDRILRNCRSTTCVLVGGAATEAIDDSTRQGAAFGYRVVLPADAIYPASEEHLRQTLGSRAETSTTREVLDLVTAGGLAEQQPVASR
jgi:nicotinamidase-related amidase